MMTGFNDDPPINVEFTRDEKVDIQKTIVNIQQNFMKSHQEITLPSSSDLAAMIRQEKQTYASLGIMFAVHSMAAMENVKKS